MPVHEFDQVPDATIARTRRVPGAERAPASPIGLLGASSLMKLQREAGNTAVAGLLEEERSPVLDVVGRGGGSPMDAGLRRDMEGRLGADFSDVRFHTDSAAHESARSVGARAYTVGRDVVFQREAYDPSSTSGLTTIAHELTHVMQQRSGPVAGTDAGNGVQISDPGDAFETAAAANAQAAVAVQREESEEEEELQM